jgi:hypothetical protein
LEASTGLGVVLVVGRTNSTTKGTVSV